MKNLQPFIHLLLIAFLLGGCASFEEADLDARNTARLAHQRLLSVKKEVRRKIDAERFYYEQSLNTLDQYRRRANDVSLRRDMIKTAIRETKTMKSNDLVPEKLAPKLTAKATDVVARFESAKDEARKARRAHEEAIQKLFNLENEYSALERTLVDLSVTPGKRDQIVQIGTFILETAKHYRELEKEREKEDSQ